MSKLLQEIVKKHKLDINKFFANDGAFILGNEVDRETLLDAITSEFCETGLQSNDEPNKRGLMLEDLIGLVNNLKERKPH